MIIVQENQKLEEMAILVVSSRDDNLPFRITIKSPDHQPPHAHIMDLKTGKIELGQFLLSRSMPRSLKDIKDYKQGLADEMRQKILEWAPLKNKRFNKNNWDALCSEWMVNEKW
jgi:hypothetical protein